MNQLTTYEILIADKVAQLPVTDMADSTWADIEQQLDIYLPEDVNGNTFSPATKGKVVTGPGIYFIIVATVIFILIVLLVFNNANQKERNSKEQPSLPAPKKMLPENDSSTDSNQANGKADSELYIPVTSTIKKNDTINANKNTITDSVDVINKGDSIINNNDDFVKPPINKTADSILTGSSNIVKKPKGVQGISDDDYKISVLKKDSLKNKN